MEFQRTGHYDLVYMKTKELAWKETQGIQNIGIEDSQESRIVQLIQVMKQVQKNVLTKLLTRTSNAIRNISFNLCSTSVNIPWYTQWWSTGCNQLYINKKIELKIWENYITEIYDWPNQPEKIEVEPEEEVDTD